MFCTNCGSQIAEGVKFCPNCGKMVESAQTASAPVYDEPVTRPEAGKDNSTSILVLGILALAFSELGIPGIILGAIAKKKAGLFMAENGILYGKAKVGRILGKIGFIVGIVMTVFWVLYIGIIGTLIGSACAYSSSYPSYYY